MGDLIKITEKDGKQLVSARELHKFLENTDNVNNWFKRQAERAMLVENEDFTRFAISQTSGQRSFDYALSISSAKEIAMLNGGEKGKQARRYFIEMEKIAKDLSEINSHRLPSNLKEAYLALAQAEEEKELLLIQNENLNTVLDNLLEWVSIIKVCEHNKVKEHLFEWRKLKAKSNELGYQIKRAESPRFGYMNLYHINAFRACYPNFDYNINS